MEDLVKLTLLTRDRADDLVDRYSERKESAAELSKRVGQRSIQAVLPGPGGSNSPRVTAGGGNSSLAPVQTRGVD